MLSHTKDNPFNSNSIITFSGFAKIASIKSAPFGRRGTAGKWQLEEQQ